MTIKRTKQRKKKIVDKDKKDRFEEIIADQGKFESLVRKVASIEIKDEENKDNAFKYGKGENGKNGFEKI